MSLVTHVVLSGRTIIAFGSAIVMGGAVLWSLPRWAKKEFGHDLAESEQRAATARKIGDAQADQLARDYRNLRQLSVRALGVVIGGVIVILIGVARL